MPGHARAWAPRRTDRAVDVLSVTRASRLWSSSLLASPVLASLLSAAMTRLRNSGHPPCRTFGGRPLPLSVPRQQLASKVDVQCCNGLLREVARVSTRCSPGSSGGALASNRRQQPELSTGSGAPALSEARSTGGGADDAGAAGRVAPRSRHRAAAAPDWSHSAGPVPGGSAGKGPAPETRGVRKRSAT